MYLLYDTKNNYQCVGLFDNAEQVSIFTGNSVGSVYSAVTRKNLLRSRYEIIKEE